MQDQEFLETIVKAIVDYPEDVVVEREIDERGVLLTLKVNPEEMGKIIGKQGQTARSLRTLLRIVGNKNNSYVNLKVYEPEKEGREHREKRDENVTPVESAPVEAAPVEAVPEAAPVEEISDADVDDLKL